MLEFYTIGHKISANGLTAGAVAESKERKFIL
jgi:hypothetical protein